ncbi:hypothetical protein BH23ACT9_BH23ACT9_14030 [soil metagenome]
MSGDEGAAGIAAQTAELAAIRRRVLNVIGHELRTPVTTLHGLAEQACVAEDLQTVTAEIGPALLRNAERLTVLLDDLLIAAGIRTAVPVGGPEEIDLTSLVEEIWEELSPTPLQLAGGPHRVTLPVVPVRRALHAVLDNAVAYGTGAPQVTLSSVEGTATVTVQSPGPALHPEEVHLATEAFFRGERAVTTRPGLGVGLAIALAMADHVGGTLRFEGDGGGTVTTITLPQGGVR